MSEKDSAWLNSYKKTYHLVPMPKVTPAERIATKAADFERKVMYVENTPDIVKMDEPDYKILLII